RAELKSNASSESQLLLPVMFQVSVSCKVPFVDGRISFANASNVPKSRFTREEKLWGSICAGRKGGKNSRILREFTKNYPRDHNCFLSRVPSPLLTRRAIFP